MPELEKLPPEFLAFKYLVDQARELAYEILSMYDATERTWYYWTQARLLVPLYNINASDTAFRNLADNLSSIEQARDARKTTKTPISTDPKPLRHTY